MTTPDTLHDRRSRVASLTRAGLSLTQIADQLGVTDRTVSRDRQRLGIQQPTPPRLSAAEVEAARRLLDDGAPYSEVARTLGRSHSAIARRLPGYAWTPVQRGQWQAFLNQTRGN